MTTDNGNTTATTAMPGDNDYVDPMELEFYREYCRSLSKRSIDDWLREDGYLIEQLREEIEEMERVASGLNPGSAELARMNLEISSHTQTLKEASYMHSRMKMIKSLQRRLAQLRD